MNGEDQGSRPAILQGDDPGHSPSQMLFLFKLKEKEESNISPMISLCQSLCQVLIWGYILHNRQCKKTIISI